MLWLRDISRMPIWIFILNRRKIELNKKDLFVRFTFSQSLSGQLTISYVYVICRQKGKAE